MPTTVVGLDERLEGGIPVGSMVLVAGTAGSLKSSLVYRILHHQVCTTGRKAMFVSFEQSQEQMLAQMARLGLGQQLPAGLNLVDLTEFRTQVAEVDDQPWLETFLALTQRYVAQSECDLLAIDSLDALYALAALDNPRAQLFHFLHGLRALNVTTFLISESPRGSERFGHFGIEEFLSDGIIHLRVREEERGNHTALRRYLGVVKMRQTAHDMDYHPLLLVDGRFELVVD